ncbi:tetratricopeptide repeat protein [Chryseobacterium sp. WG14]|uniref:tetratricopeptide repeat protein n=1 Tax=unclassified Chryseobacterium TaxID=2593645 RepID=UPI00211F3184|nr:MULTISPECIES: tetratricopeptide repeat protein [unclassified Chryseobacterium]MCQ9634250.1 tetratricopeptide repeat protein [Chryseobacterium sp. WG23]MCQ9638083.1 tetratricopeptide repeat protein [Chryseobacterium sp. WG14]
MKKFIFIITCVFCSLIHGQLITNPNIDNKIILAKELSSEEPGKSLQLSEEIYRVSTNAGYKKGILESSNLMMAKYYDLGNFKKVVELSKATEGLAIEMKDNEILSNIYRLRASSYTELGFNAESLKEFQKALNTIHKIESDNYKYYQESLIYIGLASYSAHINAPVDSVAYYQRKSLETINKVNDSKDFSNKKNHSLILAYINLGKTSIVMHKAKDAESFFSKALELCQNKTYRSNKNLEIATLNEFAWLYYDQKRYNESKLYAEKAEKLEKQVSSPYIRRDIYEVYFKSCVELGEKEISKKYMNLYTKLNDSLVNAEKKTINTPVKHIIDEQSEIYNSNIQKILIAIFILILTLSAAGWFFWKRKQKALHKKYELIITNLKTANATASNANIAIERSINITDETVKTLLLKLEKFEKSQKFLKKDLSLTSLANDLNTNTRYLSEIIKQYKEKSYNNYINELRINYIINKLCIDPIYREYKISYLAEACGFSSREVFAVTFKKEAGVTPSYFINNLRKDNEINIHDLTPQ